MLTDNHQSTSSQYSPNVQKDRIFNNYMSKPVFFRKKALTDALALNFMKSISDIGYAHYFSSKSQVVKLLRTSHFPKNWHIELRLNAIFTHYTLLKSLPKFLDVTHGQSHKILDLNTYSKDMALICTRPNGEKAEGEACLQLVKEDIALMSVPFTLGLENNELVIYIWSIQQSSADVSMLFPLYKEFSGLRTQDLMMEMVRLVAVKINAKKILAIKDESRLQPFSTFGITRKYHFALSYDDVWMRYGGTQVADDFYELSVESKRVELEAIPISKRSMINRRYSILSNIAQTLDTLKYLIHFSIATKLVTEFMSGISFFYNTYVDLHSFI